MKKKRIKNLIGLFSLVFLGFLALPETAKAWVEHPLETRINLRFVYPDNTVVTSGLNNVQARITNQTYKGVAHPTNSSLPATFSFENSQQLKAMHEIPKVSNGIFQESFTTSSAIGYGGIAQEGDGFQTTRLMNGAIVGYTDLTINTDYYVKNIKGKTTSYTGWAYLNSFLSPPSRWAAHDRMNIPLTNSTQLTQTSKGVFKLQSPPKIIDLYQHLPQNSVEFTRMEGSTGYKTSFSYNFWDGSEQIQYKYFSEPFTFEVEVPKIIENFVSSAGTPLAAGRFPNGVTQGNTYYADNNIYTMGSHHNQLDTLPESYTKLGTKYLYKGWYLTSTKGAVYQSNPPSFKWKDVPSGQEDEYGKVNVIYDEAKKYSVKEKYVYIDEHGNNVDIQASWNKTTSNQFELDSFIPSAQPAAEKIDSLGTKWSYVGWKVGVNGVVNNTSMPAEISSLDDSNNELYYVYEKSSTSAKMNLTPDSTVIHSFDKPIQWKLVIENTGSADLKNLDLTHAVTKMTYHSMTSPTDTIVMDNNNVSLSGFTDNLWTDGGAELSNIKVKPGEKITLTFNTIPSKTGDLDIFEHVMKFTVSVDGNIATPLSDTTTIRIDDDHHSVTETEGNTQLALLLVPNIFDFGFNAKANISTTQELSLDTSKYSDKANSRGIIVRLQDPRNNAVANRWKLSAKLGRFENSSGDQLPSTVKLRLSTAYSESVANVNQHNENRSSGSTSIDLNSNIELPADDMTTVKLMSNKQAKNSGTWQLRVPLSGITMQLPANVGQKGQVYTNEITWTLEDTI